MRTDPVVHIVDDDEAVRDSLEMLLRVLGFTVKTWASPVAFLASEAAREPGCLLVDIRMPEMDGLTLLGKLRAQGATIPVIVMTGHGDVPLAVQAMRNGALDFLEKPLAKAQLLASIRAALAGLAKPAVASSPHIEKLSPRELDVLRGLVTGLPNKSIAYDLGISPRTVEIHRARVMDKMGARNFSDLIRLALAAGLRPEDK
ncbi:MAG TPA: response regulator [Rhodopila sp.]|jgi:two-component system response regulator FixJ|nr:response regulator [Rhodopila sp.]